MRIAIIGNGELAAQYAAHAVSAGHEIVRAGMETPEAWPADVPFETVAGADDLAQLLTERELTVVVLFGPEFGERQTVAVAQVVQAVGRVQGVRLIYWGSAQVYGRPADVQGRVLLEREPLRAGGKAAAALDADSAVQELAAVRSGDVHLFRAAQVVGESSARPFDALGDLGVVPTPAAHRHLQLLDPRDALAVLDRAVAGGHPGVYNVAADGILKVDEACRALGKSTVRLPRGVLSLAAYGARWTGRVTSARALLHLTAGTPVLDNARLKTHLGFRPRFTSRQALAAARDGAASATVGSAHDG